MIKPTQVTAKPRALILVEGVDSIMINVSKLRLVRLGPSDPYYHVISATTEKRARVSSFFNPLQGQGP